MTTFSEARRIVYDQYARDAAAKAQTFGVSPDGLEDDVAWGVDAGVVDPEDGHLVSDVLYLVDKTDGELRPIPWQPDGHGRALLMEPVMDRLAADRRPPYHLLP